MYILKDSRLSVIVPLIKMNTFTITDSHCPSLTADQLVPAMDDLYVKRTYPKVNRKFIDPVKQSEPRFALFTFITTDDTTTNIYGVAKIRGVFYTQEEADARAEELIRDVDSCNSIFTCIVGVPFPLVSNGCSESVAEIDMKAKVEDTISENVRKKRNADQKEMNEITDRQKRLMEDVHPEKIKNDEDSYVEQRVKLAHLKYSISEHSAKIVECENLKKKTETFLRDAVKTNPEFEDTYLQKYKDARRAANIPEDTDLVGFMKYMADSLYADE